MFSFSTFIILVISITIFSIESADNPRAPAELTTESSESCESTHLLGEDGGTKYGTDDAGSAVSTRELPGDCWSTCSEFLTPRNGAAFRSLSTEHNQAYSACMVRCYQTEQLRPLLSVHSEKGKFHTMEDIEKKVILFTGGPLDLSDGRSLRLLHRFQALNGHKLVRGLNYGSPRTAFLSVWMQSLKTPTESLLVICRFNATGLQDITMCRSNTVYWDIAFYERHPIGSIAELQKLLVDGQMELYGHTWTMEYENMCCCRKSAFCTQLCPMIIAWFLLCIALSLL